MYCKINANQKQVSAVEIFKVIFSNQVDLNQWKQARINKDIENSILELTKSLHSCNSSEIEYKSKYLYYCTKAPKCEFQAKFGRTS